MSADKRTEPKLYNVTFTVLLHVSLNQLLCRLHQKLYKKDEKRLKKQKRKQEIEELTQDDTWFVCKLDAYLWLGDC